LVSKHFFQYGFNDGFKNMISNKTKQSGVTLIELIVVIAIFAIVSSVLLFNYSDFSTNVSIRNLSQEVALSVRKAQTYATSVKGIENTNLSTRDYPSYGISFSLDATSGPFEPNTKQFVLFADVPSIFGTLLPNKQYETNGTCGVIEPGSECIENFSINTSDSIIEFCTDVTGCVSSGSIDITFRRPVPDAIICYKSSSSDTTCLNTTISNVDIVLQSAKGLRRTVSVWNTGQISVK
jgi:prepilin-type N-terminal cleavage/methylation domain-containing protein